MELLNLRDWPPLANAALFIASGGLIWFGGTRLSAYADKIARTTGASRAFLGAVLLGGVTSLPELSTTLSASALGNAPLAVNNLLGGVGMQVAVLALADAASRGGPLSQVRGPPTILLQGVLSILVISVLAGGIVLGEPEGFLIGPWAIGATLVALGGFYVLQRHGEAAPAERGTERVTEREDGKPPYAQTLVVALVVLVGGTVASLSADVIAEQTGLGAGLVGFFLLALATSLPEISTTMSAARMGLRGMAFSNIFGSNVFDLSFVGLADLVYGGEPVLNGLGAFSVFGALLGIVLTCLYLAGIVERADRSIGRFGFDSVLVVVVYAAGAVGMYWLR